jgi:methyl-accepting chemotaxis protein
MKLLTKFNLILLLLFAAGGLVISQVLYRFLVNNAEREVLQEAELMMASVNAVREYTSSDLRPLLERNPEHEKRFLAETVPAFGAITTFKKLKQNYPEYSYQEATLNPTNPEHRATDWEADVIAYLRDHPEQRQVNGQRDTSVGPSMYLATPLSVGPPCLECHSTPSAAPPAMIATYGPNNGFGWKLGSIVGAQIVSVPMSVPLRKASQAFHLLLAYLIGTLVVTIIVLDAAVYFIVIRPLKVVADAADRASKGEGDQAQLPVKGSDEVAAVTASFNRMQLSLAKAFKMLG